MRSEIRPVYPGRILRREFMEPPGVTPYRLAKATGLSQARIANIVRGRRGIAAETALRLAQALGVSARTRMNLRTLYDLERATLEATQRIGSTTARLVLAAAA